jgi:hypothetical protein
MNDESARNIDLRKSAGVGQGSHADTLKSQSSHKEEREPLTVLKSKAGKVGKQKE